MPSTKWSNLNHLQLGRYAEYYAKMEFASYGFEVYTSEVDDHGIDFVAKMKGNEYLEIQVKAVRKTNYVFMQKDKWDISNANTFLVLLLFDDGELPDVFLIPATAWQKPNALLCDKDYEGLKSKPEYGINLSKKNMELLNIYKIEKMMNSNFPVNAMKLSNLQTDERMSAKQISMDIQCKDCINSNDGTAYSNHYTKSCCKAYPYPDMKPVEILLEGKSSCKFYKKSL